MVKVKQDPSKLHIPGALQVNQTHTFEIITGLSTDPKYLENGGFQFKHAQALSQFLMINLPSGIYKKFVLLMLKHDVVCNNYIADKLKINRKEMKIKVDGRLDD